MSLTTSKDFLAIHNQALNAIEKQQKVPSEKPLAREFSNFPIQKKAIPKFEHAHYVLCNEQGQSETLETVKQLPSRSNGVHLGFAAWMNFDLISLSQPHLAIICDVDPDMMALLEKIKECTLQSNTPDEFIDTLWDAFEKNIDQFQGLLGIDTFHADKDSFKKALTNKNQWLSSPVQFAVIKRMYADGRIIHRQLNLTDPSGKFQEIQNWAIKNNLVFDTIYLSNITEWLDANANKQMKSNIDQIKDPRTSIISAWKDNPNTGHPIQHHKTGELPVKANTSKKRPTGLQNFQPSKKIKKLNCNSSFKKENFPQNSSIKPVALNFDSDD